MLEKSVKTSEVLFFSPHIDRLSVWITFRAHSLFPYTCIPMNLTVLSRAEREKERRQKSRSPSGDVLPCRHCNLLYKLHVSTGARLKTSSSVYQSPVNCWVNFPLTLVLWFITLLQIWHCQSKRSGRAFSDWPSFLFCLLCHPQFIWKKKENMPQSLACYIYQVHFSCSFRILRTV